MYDSLLSNSIKIEWSSADSYGSTQNEGDPHCLISLFCDPSLVFQSTSWQWVRGPLGTNIYWGPKFGTEMAAVLLKQLGTVAFLRHACKNTSKWLHAGIHNASRNSIWTSSFVTSCLSETEASVLRWHGCPERFTQVIRETSCIRHNQVCFWMSLVIHHCWLKNNQIVSSTLFKK